MRKLLILLLMAAATVFSLSGCGGGSSGDPLGTDSITFTDAAGSGQTWWVDPNETVVLTATVTNASGAAAVSQDVTFGFAANASGATLSRAEARTDSAGKALITYKAGPTAGDDIVRASINNGNSAVVYITAGGTATTTTYAISVVAGVVSALGGQSVVEATIEKLEVDSAGGTITTPRSGVTVNFIVLPGGTGLGSISPDSAITDGSGNAVTVYKGGAVAAGGSYSDVVQASFTIGGITYSNATVIDYSPP